MLRAWRPSICLSVCNVRGLRSHCAKVEIVTWHYRSVSWLHACRRLYPDHSVLWSRILLSEIWKMWSFAVEVQNSTFSICGDWNFALRRQQCVQWLACRAISASAELEELLVLISMPTVHRTALSFLFALFGSYLTCAALYCLGMWQMCKHAYLLTYCLPLCCHSMDLLASYYEQRCYECGEHYR